MHMSHAYLPIAQRSTSSRLAAVARVIHDTATLRGHQQLINCKTVPKNENLPHTVDGYRITSFIRRIMFVL